MIKTGIEAAAYFDMYDYEEGLRKAKRDGYDCIDYQNLSNTACDLYKMNEMDFEKYLRKVGEKARANGIEVHQAHGKWPMDDQTEIGRQETIGLFIKEIKGCHYLGCKYLVIHPFMPYGWHDGREEERVFDMNVKMLLKLMPYAEQYNVTVCVENLPFPEVPISRTEEVKRLVHTVNYPYCKVCFDTGHANVCCENLADCVRMLGEDLATLHVHDNKGLDVHLIPYQGNICWSEFLSALKEIGFRNCFSLETYIARSMPEEPKETMRLGLSRLARIMANQIE